MNKEKYNENTSFFDCIPRILSFAIELAEDPQLYGCENLLEEYLVTHVNLMAQEDNPDTLATIENKQDFSRVLGRSILCTENGHERKWDTFRTMAVADVETHISTQDRYKTLK